MNARSLKLWLHLFALLSVTACGGNAGAPNQPPTASFTATPSEGAAPLEVLFDASASADPDGSITAYAWDFRDGNAGAGRTTRHTFTAPGNYEVKLTVTDDGGKTGEKTRTVAVTASNGNDGDNRAPLARDDLAVTNLGRPVTINVLANDEDPDGDPLTVTVVSNPANGSAAINEGATVTYTPNEGFVGTDAFTYEIADGRGGAATATVTVQVSAFNEVHYLPGMRTLVYHQGRFYHVYYDDSSGDPDVYLRSSDDGVSWSRVRVSDGVPGASEGIAGLAVWEEDGGTHVAVSWQDGRGERQQLRVAVSTNGGSSFGPSTQVSNHGDSNAIRASLAVDEAGVLYAAWTRIDGAGGWNEVFFSKSSDGGSSWSTPTVVLNSGFFGADTHIAAGASGKVWIAAATDDSFRKNLRMLRSEDGGLSWSQSMVTNYTVGGSFADHPSLALDEAGTLYAIWQNRAGSGQPMRVFVARSTDGGETWTGYTQVSDDVVLDEGQYDTYAPPSLQAGRGGRLYAVWADGREGSNASPDSRNYDVYLSHSDDGGATWNADMRINDRPEVLGQYRASLAIKPGDLQDEVLVAWEDMRATGTDGTRYSQLHYRKLTPP